MVFADATYVDLVFLELLYGGTTLLVLLLLVQSMEQMLRNVLQGGTRSRWIGVASQGFHAVGLHVVLGGTQGRGRRWQILRVACWYSSMRREIGVVGLTALVVRLGVWAAVLAFVLRAHNFGLLNLISAQRCATHRHLFFDNRFFDLILELQHVFRVEIGICKLSDGLFVALVHEVLALFRLCQTVRGVSRCWLRSRVLLINNLQIVFARVVELKVVNVARIGHDALRHRVS